MRWVLSVLVLFSCLRVASAQELKPLKSKHYDLKTNLADTRERNELLSFLEAMNATYLKVFNGKPVREVTRAQVRVYTTKAGYEAFGRGDKDVNFNANWRGYYARDRNELVSYRGDNFKELLAIVSHEGFHQFAWQYMVPTRADVLPEWYEEGLAEYFRSWSQKGRYLEDVELDYHKARVKTALKAGRAWKVEELLSSKPAAITDPTRFDEFYAHAYLLMDFLVRYSKKSVLKVYKLKKEGKASAEIVDEVFPKASRPKLEKAFYRFLQSLK